jgi:predicted nucleotide-binding protein (sugar kinase/HSP70/actin superfamily)
MPTKEPIKEKPIVTFARWGNYTIAVKGLLEQLGMKVILPPKTNSTIISEGAKIAPELFCFPMKVTLGGYLAVIKEGVNTILSVQNVGGSCRQKYYGLIQEKVLRDGGYKVRFVDFRATPREIFKALGENSGASNLQIASAFYTFYQKLAFIEKIEKIAAHIRPREIHKGGTEKIVREALVSIEKTKNLKEILNLKKQIISKLKKVEIDNNREVFKVGMMGEIYTVTDPVINFDLEAKLGLDGIEIHREMNLSYQLKKLAFPWIDWMIQRRVFPYLESTVGGHGRDAISEMLTFVEEDFDGVIQLLPFGCMPEVTVRPILEKIRQENNIPFLSLSLDEQVAEAGINTRLEAFADVVKNYHFKKQKDLKNLKIRNPKKI